MNTQKFMREVQAEAQAQWEFNQESWPNDPGDKEDAVRTVLECCSAELSMQDYADAIDAVGAGKHGFVAAIAAALK
jgi:hypothetical protein